MGKEADRLRTGSNSSDGLTKFTSSELDIAWKVNNEILGQINVSVEEASIQPEIMRRLALARARETQEAETKRLQKIIDQRNSTTRRNFISGAAWIGGSLGFLGLAGKGFYEVFFSEGAQERDRQERANREIAQATSTAVAVETKTTFETNQILGLRPTITSSTNWRVRYLSRQETQGAEYEEIRGKGGLLRVNNEGTIVFEDFYKQKNTGVSLHGYTTNSGVRATEISILKPGATTNYRENFERWLLREQTDQVIDTRLLLLEDTLNNEQAFVRVLRSQSQNVSFEVQLLKRRE